MGYSSIWSKMKSNSKVLKVYVRVYLEYDGMNAYENLLDKKQFKTKHNAFKNLLYIIHEILRQNKYNTEKFCVFDPSIHSKQDWICNVEDVVHYAVLKMEDALEIQKYSFKRPLKPTTFENSYNILLKHFKLVGRSKVKGDYKFFATVESDSNCHQI